MKIALTDEQISTPIQDVVPTGDQISMGLTLEDIVAERFRLYYIDQIVDSIDRVVKGTKLEPNPRYASTPQEDYEDGIRVSHFLPDTPAEVMDRKWLEDARIGLRELEANDGEDWRAKRKANGSR